MKNTIALIFLSVLAFSVNAENTVLKNTEQNCAKLRGPAKSALMTIANDYKVSVSSVVFLESQWDAPYCLLTFDTPKGPKRCHAHQLLSSDGGKTSFGVLNPYGTQGASCY